MPNTKSNKMRPKKTHKKQPKKTKQVIGPSPNISVYRGPLKYLEADRNNTDTRVVTLHEVSSTVFASSAGGVMNITFNMTPSTATDWSNWASNYREARLLGCRIEYKPNDRYSKTTTVTKPALAAVDHSTAAATIASYSDLVAYASCKDVSLDDFWSVEWRMSGTEESSFKDISAVTAPGHIYVYSTGLSVSQNYGLCVIYWLVQFRGRA